MRFAAVQVRPPWSSAIAGIRNVGLRHKTYFVVHQYNGLLTELFGAITWSSDELENVEACENNGGEKPT